MRAFCLDASLKRTARRSPPGLSFFARPMQQNPPPQTTRSATASSAWKISPENLRHTPPAGVILAPVPGPHAAGRWTTTCNPSPPERRAVRGMIHLVAEHDRRRLANACIFEVSRLEKEGPAMPFDPIVFARLLKPISRRRFSASVARHDADAYDKNFSSWDHLVALVFAQLSGAGSLRGLEAGWAANGHHHYHLGAGRGGSFARPCQMRPVDARLRFLRTPFQTSPGLRAGRCAG